MQTIDEFRRDPREPTIYVIIDRDRVRVLPEVLRVHVGQAITWLFIWTRSPRTRFVEVYFPDGSPLGEDQLEMPIETSPGLSAEIRVEATKPGDFKYGVRNRASPDGPVLDDEDPWLIVRW